MDLFYFRDHHGNFGDALNDWMWDAMLPDREAHAPDVWLSGIGTILNHRMPRARRWVVLGSGAGYGARPIDFGGPNWDVLAVRGPLSARVLGLEAERAITDGAMLLSLLPEYAPNAQTPPRRGIAFMPHYMSVADGAWAEACELAGLEFIDSRSDTREILAKIRSSKVVIADAMHAAIVADTLRTPWIAISLNATTDSFKWNDWCWSMHVKHSPHRIPSSTLADVIRSNTLRMYGEHLLMDQACADVLCAHYARRSRQQSSAVQLRYKVAKRVCRELATGASGLERRFASGLAQGRIERAAHALRHVATLSPMLSDEPVFLRQRQRMAAELMRLADRYGLAVAGNLTT